jgi:outer membrane immunogenic protein
MKKLLLGIAAIVALFTAPALAADMPLKAPPAVVSAEYNWSGFYVGANAGWMESNFHWQYTNPSPATCCAPFSADVSNAIIGGQIGAQWQWSHIVLGVEAAVDDFINRNKATGPGCVAPNSLTISCEITPNSLGTVGGRLGYAWSNWLIFGDAGGAWSSVSTNLNANVGTAPLFDFTGAKHSGWYAGGGIEYVLVRGSLVDLIGGLEYQHIDLGSQVESSPLDANRACPPGVNCRNVGATEDLVRVRLSVKINPFAPAN